MSPLPENLEKVADAGGWDERALEQAKEFMEKAGKIKEKEWKAMTGTLGALKDIVDAGGMEGMLDRWQETLSLQVENAFSPLANEVSQAVADALAPILPMITATLQEVTKYFTLGLGGLEAALTGNWDTWIETEIVKFQDSMSGWSEEWINFHTQVQIFFRTIEKWRADQIAAGTAAGQAALSWANDVNQWWYDLWGSLGWR